MRVAVKVPSEHVQPRPLIAVAVRPAGSVSVSVTVPLEATFPALVTVNVYVSPTFGTNAADAGRQVLAALQTLKGSGVRLNLA